MKLIIAGASGFVGSEVVRQALHRPEITSVIALSRTATTLKPGTAGSEKLKNVIIEDYDKYPGDVSKELAGAAGCIW